MTLILVKSVKVSSWGRRHAPGEVWPRTYYTYDKTTEIFIFLPRAQYLGATRNPATFHIYVCEQKPLILGKERTKFAASLAGNLIWVSRQASTNWMYIRTLFSLLSTLLSRYLQLFQPSEDMHILLYRGPIVCRRVPTTNRQYVLHISLSLNSGICYPEGLLDYGSSVPWCSEN